MADRPDFQEKQYAFARHIRDPANNPSPVDAEDRRLAIYRELFFNNLHNLISQTFPVLKKLHSPDKWNAFIRGFMVRHEAHTPYFLEIPREFLAFLQDEYEFQDDDLPFLLELAHYEWVELSLSVSDEVNDMSGVDPEGNLLDGIPVKSKLAWLFAYSFPVHRISKDFKPTSPGAESTFLALCRKSDDAVEFTELNPVSAKLLELISANESNTGRQLLSQLATEINYADPEMLVSHGHDAMKMMLDAEILLGVK
jgi:hypothetical protein